MLFDELRIFLTNNYGQQFDEILFQILDELNMEIADFESSSLHQRQEMFFKVLENNEKLRLDPQKTWELKEILQLTARDEAKIIDDKTQKRRMAMRAFLEKLEKAYFKENLIIELYVTHSIDAEIRSLNHETVKDVIAKALSSISEKLEDEYAKLQEQFEVPKELRLKRNIFARSSDADASNYSEIFTMLDGLWKNACSSFSEIHKCILELQEQAIKVCQTGKDYHNLIEKKKIIINNVWDSLENKYDEFMEKSGLNQNK